MSKKKQDQYYKTLRVTDEDGRVCWDFFIGKRILMQGHGYGKVEKILKPKSVYGRYKFEIICKADNSNERVQCGVMIVNPCTIECE